MTEKSELLIPTPLTETHTTEQTKGSDSMESEMRVNAPSLDSLPQILENYKDPIVPPTASD